MYRRALVSTSLTLTCLCGVSLGANAQTADDGLVLQPGDHLVVTVLDEDKDMSGEFEVAPDGTLRHPLYNQIVVAGVPLSDLKTRFDSFLRRFQKEPQLELEPRFKVNVAGEVMNPSIYFLSPQTTVGDALVQAKVTDRADVDHVLVLRDGKKLTLNLNPNSANRDLHTVRSGDQINVAARHDMISGLGRAAPILSVTASLVSIAFYIVTHHR